MQLDRFVKPVPEISPDEVRAYVKANPADSFNLLDVRQPEEYTEDHLPGARLIPVGELQDRLGEIDRSKPTIVYCRAGVRGSSGASILIGAGFEDVRNMTGGVLAWRGFRATGAPESGLTWVDDSQAPGEVVALAWAMEKGAQEYYEALAGYRLSPDLTGVFEFMAREEAGHARLMLESYRKLTGGDETPEAKLGPKMKRIMEGGVDLDRLLDWITDRPIGDILEVTMSIEANAHDRYLKLSRTLSDPALHQVFLNLAEREKAHLDELTRLFDGNR
jgi:rhodanese-related sulfurtransferase/rubrerythrin